MEIHEITKVTETNEPEVYLIECKITDMNGETYETTYGSRPEDTFGLNPKFREWLIDNPNFPRQPFVPPTAEETRAGMSSLTARQLRLGLLAGGISPATVTATIDAMSAGPDRDAAQIEWEYATTFNRMHPLISTVGGALGRTEEQMDAMWEAALLK